MIQNFRAFFTVVPLSHYLYDEHVFLYMYILKSTCIIKGLKISYFCLGKQDQLKKQSEDCSW